MISEIKQLKLNPIEQELEKTFQEINSCKTQIDKIVKKIEEILGPSRDRDIVSVDIIEEYLKQTGTTELAKKSIENLKQYGEMALEEIASKSPDMRHPSLKYSFVRKAFYSKKKI